MHYMHSIYLITLLILPRRLKFGFSCAPHEDHCFYIARKFSSPAHTISKCANEVDGLCTFELCEGVPFGIEAREGLPSVN